MNINIGDERIAIINGKLRVVKIDHYHRNFDMWMVKYRGGECLISEKMIFQSKQELLKTLQEHPNET